MNWTVFPKGWKECPFIVLRQSHNLYQLYKQHYRYVITTYMYFFKINNSINITVMVIHHLNPTYIRTYYSTVKPYLQTLD